MSSVATAAAGAPAAVTEEDELCMVMSTELPPLDFRPRSHHLLYKRDEHFDSRLNAFFRCEEYLQATYDATLRRLHHGLVDLLVEDYARVINANAIEMSTSLSQSSVDMGISISCVTSTLSDVDRSAVVDDVIVQFETRVTSVLAIAETSCQRCASAHDFFVQLTESVRHRLARRATEEQRYRGAKAKIIMKASNDFSSLIHDAPIESLFDLLSLDTTGTENSNSSNSGSHTSGSSSSGATKGCLVVVLRNAERLHLSVFGSILDIMYSILLPVVNLHLVLVCSASCPLPLRLDKFPRSLLRLTLRHTANPLEFYDVFMGNNYTTEPTNTSLLPTPFLSLSLFNSTTFLPLIQCTNISTVLPLTNPTNHPLHILSEHSNEPFIHPILLGKVFAGSELPVVFPASVINWLHEKFWRSNSCVKGILS